MHVKSVRGFDVLHVLIIPLEVPSQVKISHLEVGSKFRDPKSESEVGLPPTGGSLKKCPSPQQCALDLDVAV